MSVRWIAAATLVLAAGAGAAVRAVEPKPAPVAAAPFTPAPPPSGGRQGIVLITVDSLRADRVGAYAPGKPTTTPALDLLAATGVRFERAYAASVSTAPSAASILTGLLPAQHGLRDDLGGHLAPGVRTIADRLRAAGWATTAVVGTDRFDSTRGLGAGFDRYDDEIKGLRKIAAKMPAMLSMERRAAEVVDRVLVAFEAMPAEKPFFLWAAFHDPHYDYDPPEPQKSAFPDAPYDGEVAAVDAAIGSLTRTLRDRIPGGRLLFVVAGTHGEGLGDRREVGHGFYLNESTIRVPLVMVSGKPRGHGGNVIDTPVSLLDLAPTILEVAGLPPAEGLAGVSHAALLAAAAGAAPAEASESRRAKRTAPRRIYVEAAAPATAYGWSPLFSVTEGARRVVQGERLESFDLGSDPAAATPLPSAPRWTKDLVAHGRAQFGSLDPPEERRREIDAAIVALGAPWEGSLLCGSRDTHPDPRDPVPLEVQEPLFYARLEMAWNIAGRAWRRGTEVLAKDPANPTALETVIFLALRNNWGEQALLDPLEIMTCQYPYRPGGYHYLGHFYTKQRNWEQALKAFRLMELTDPGDEEAHYDLACTYAAMGRKDEAFGHLEKSIALGSDDFARMRRDHRLAPLRDDPRYESLVPVPDDSK